MELELISLNGSGILLDQVNNLAATVAKSQERKDRTTKLDHADRIIDILETEGELTLQSPLRTAVYLHDVIYTGSRNNQSYNGEFLSNVYSRLQGKKPAEYAPSLYALGVACSAQQFEDVAEQWREHIFKYAVCTVNHPPELAFLEDSIRTTLENYHGSTVSMEMVSEYKFQLIAALTDGGVPVSDEMMAWRAPMADPAAILGVISSYDIEGLIIKSAEVIDNLRFPNPERPAAAWRDAQELLSFYQPLLEVAGFKKLAMIAQDTAFTHLNSRDPHLVTTARELNAKGKAFFNEFGQTLLMAVPESILVSDKEYRIKTPGSIQEKLRTKDKGLGMVPDAIGLNFVIADTNLNATSRSEIIQVGDIHADLAENRIAQFMRLSLEVLNGVLEAVPGIEPEHTRPGEPSIEINFGDKEEFSELFFLFNGREPEAGEPLNLKTTLSGKGISLKLHTARKSGYQAAHLSFKYDGLGGEIKIQTDRDQYYNDIGMASHVMYKAREALGRFGYLKRRSFATPEFEREQDRLLNMFFLIRSRADFFKANYQRKFILTNGGLQKLAEIESLFNLPGLLNDEVRALIHPDELEGVELV